ncbi:MAG: M48 family metalloprotease [Actinomycetota bacterium]
MKRLVGLAVILVAAVAVLYYSQHRKPKSQVGPEGMLNAVAETEREISRIPARLTRLSDAEEVRIGNAMAQSYDARLSLRTQRDQEMQQYVTRVGQIVSGRARRKLDYKFHYIADPDFVNAFALPGGHIFIGEGLVRLMDSEDELANTLGHEIEHVDNYHCAERVQVEARLRHLPLGGLIGLPVELFMAGYSKEQELEADRDGTQLAVMAGYSPQGAVRLFQQLEKLRQEYVLKADNPSDEFSKVAIEGIIGYFRSHPLPQERLDQINEIIASKRWPQRPERALKVRPEKMESAKVRE